VVLLAENTSNKLSVNEVEKVKEIGVLFNQIKDIYVTLSDEAKEFIAYQDNEDGSLPYCIRWGLQSIEDLTE